MPDARVLIVDDIQTNIDVAKGLMKPYGMQIDQVTSGQDAIDLVKNEKVKYDVIFMDHMMPGMDGIEAVRYIRKIDSDYARNVPIIALTANAVAGKKDMFLDNGFQEFLSKPIDVHALESILRKWIKNKQVKTETADHSSNEIQSEGQTETLNETPTEATGLFSDLKIEGLDIKSGLERFNGDEKVYMEVLESYATNTKPLVETVRNVDKQNLNDYAITVHGIKSSSRGIHAEKIGALAESLEYAAKDGDYEYISKNNTDLVENISKLIVDLDEMIQRLSLKEQRPVKDEPDKSKLAELRKACEDYDIDKADDIITELEEYKYETDNDLVEWLRENVNVSNLKQIKKRLIGG
jgi:CheY-like chemotaxis protein